MQYLKTRILGVLIALLGVGLIYVNWRQLGQDHTYSVKLAAFAPFCVVGGIFVLLFPSMAGKPQTTKEKLVGIAVLFVGLLLGLINWYLMDPGFFGMKR